MFTHLRSLIAAASIGATSMAAQQPNSCPTGPGAAFGITGYQCANCSFRQEKNGRPTYLFYAEPVILQTNGAGGARVGDILEAVNGLPITTVTGSYLFTYPRAGDNQLTIRRGRERHVLEFTLPGPDAECGRPNGPSLLPGSSVAIDQRGPQPVYIVDGHVVENPVLDATAPSGPQTGPYGFAIACVPSCTAAEGYEGKTRFTYYTYDGNPPIIAIKAGSPAERAGLRVGDVITKVDGRSVLEREAAMRLGSAYLKETLHLTVLRDSKEVRILVRIP